MADIEAIAKVFASHYFTAVDNHDLAALMLLYRENSVLTFNGTQYYQSTAIVNYFKTLPTIAHQVVTIDVQPSFPVESGNLLISVTGRLAVNNGEDISFVQVFQLIADMGSYYIFNDILRSVSNDQRPIDVQEINIVNQCTSHYYLSFDNQRAALSSLYRPQSMLTFEGWKCQGTEKIMEKLNSLPVNVKHNVAAIDAQNSYPLGSGNLVITVAGKLVIDESDNPLNFSQVFQLIAEKDISGKDQYFVFNDMFRLNV